MITKQELIEIMKEGWQPSGYYSVDFNANMVADKILKRIKKEYKEVKNKLKKDLEVLDILKRTQFQIYKLGLPNDYKIYCDTYYSIPITEEEANLINKVLPIKGENNEINNK